MVTLKDIAKQVGVDVSTVSKVLQGAPIRVSSAKRDAILKVAEDLHYQPNMVARGLRLRRSGAIAMVVPSTVNYLYPEIIGGAEDTADELGLVLFLLKQSQRDPLEQMFSIAGQGRVDGFLFVDEAPNGAFLRQLQDAGIPFISLNRGGKDQFVLLDDGAGFSAQANYLLDAGHRNIAFVATAPGSCVSAHCEATFRNALDVRGTPLGEKSRFFCDFDGIEAEQVAKQILALSPRPTAVATTSVLVASRLVGEFRSAGIAVPDEISVIGYHDSPAATWPPPGITTVRMPSRVQGAAAVRALLETIQTGKYAGITIAEPPEIVERGTCRAR